MSEKFQKVMFDYDDKMSAINAMPISDFEKENLKREYCGFPNLTIEQFNAMNLKMADDCNSKSNLF